MDNITNLEATLNGLTNEQLEENKTKYGTNALTPKKVATIWEMLLGALDDVCIKILLLALGVKVVMSVIGIWVPQFHGESDLIEIISIFTNNRI